MSHNLSITEKLLGRRDPSTTTKRRVRGVPFPGVHHSTDVVFSGSGHTRPVPAAAQLLVTIAISDLATLRANFASGVSGLTAALLTVSDQATSAFHGASSEHAPAPVQLTDHADQAMMLTEGQDAPLLNLTDEGEMVVAATTGATAPNVMLSEAAEQGQETTSGEAAPQVQVAEQAETSVDATEGEAAPLVLLDEPASQGTVTGTGAFLGELDLVVAAGMVGSNLTDFPVMIRLSTLPVEFWNEVKVDGGDFRVFDANDNQLPLDMAWIDPGATDGVAFFKHTLLSGSDNVFKLRWGNHDLGLIPANDSLGRNAVWSDYECVYLLRGDLVDRAGKTTLALGAGTSTFDSTALTHLGLGGGWTSDGDDRLQCTLSSASNVFTIGITGKFVLPVVTTNYAFASRGVLFGTNTDRLALGHRNATVKWSNWDTSNSWHDSTSTPVSNQTARLHGAWNGTDRKRLFVNGTMEAETTGITAVGGSGLNFYLASGGSGTAGQLNGAIAFAYLRYTFLHAHWLAAEYANINNPGAFYSLVTP